MKSRENLVRLKRFQVNEKRRQILQLDMMIAEFDRMATELELQIAAEEKKWQQLLDPEKPTGVRCWDLGEGRPLGSEMAPTAGSSKLSGRCNRCLAPRIGLPDKAARGGVTIIAAPAAGSHGSAGNVD